MTQIKEKLYMGIDVSKDTLDIYWESKSYKIKNDLASITAFIRAEVKKGLKPLCVMESTGGYERTAVEAFRGHKLSVHVAHPSRVHFFAKAEGQFTKTDKLDAILLYKYASTIACREEGDVFLDKNHQEIIALRRLQRSLEENLHAAQCQVKQMPKCCASYLERIIAFYKKEIAKIQEKIDVKIEEIPDLKRKRDIMTTMKGVGKKTAAILLAELPELGTISKRKITSLVGVAPKTYQSGKKSLPGHIAGGRFHARKALYMIALVASRYDSLVSARYKELQQRGKPKKVALVAVMRDAITALNSMVREGQSYSVGLEKVA